MVNILDTQSLEKIRDKYHEAHSRLILLDFDGTLVPLAATPEIATINKKAESLISSLADDKKNKITIISGRERTFLEAQFKGLNITLIAEHGYFIKYPDEDWITDKKVDLSWEKEILPILNKYVSVYPGSMVERKQASLAFHYRNVKKNGTFAGIGDLKYILRMSISKLPEIKILEGDKVLEIKSRLYDKGTAVSEIINKGIFDFILSIGDDVTDEDMFETIPDYGFTFKIGLSDTKAKYNIKNQSEIYRILEYVRSD
jgi:trehalose 6-phosphate synthase/phosphatase